MCGIMHSVAHYPEEKVMEPLGNEESRMLIVLTRLDRMRGEEEERYADVFEGDDGIVENQDPNLDGFGVPF